MGWSFSHSATRAQIIEQATRGFTVPGSDYYMKTLKKCVRGNVVYAVCEQFGTCDDAPMREPMRFIRVILLAKEGGHWGYKDMDETMGPYYYNCPLSYLDMCTEPYNDVAREWREQVRANAS